MLASHITEHRLRSIFNELEEQIAVDGGISLATISDVSVSGRTLTITTTDNKRHSAQLPDGVTREEFTKELEDVLGRVDYERDRNGIITAIALKADTAWVRQVIANLPQNSGGQVAADPIQEIVIEGGELVFTFASGKELRTALPKSGPGTGIDNIALQGDELVFTLTDGSETRIPAPKGTPGDDGTGIASIALEGGELVFELTDGSEKRLPAPKGDPGVSPPAPTLRVGGVTTLPTGEAATAAITGTAPDYTLDLGIPQGAPGAAAPTPTLKIGTVGTGTASASITGAAPDYTLNLTLPSGTSSVQDTGWRDITSYLTLNQNGLGSSGKFYVRRIGQTVSFAVHDLRATAGSFGAPLTSPLPGFHMTSPGFENRYAMGSVAFLYTWAGQPTFLRCSGLIGNNSTANFNMYTYLTADPWPATLPGTPA